MLITCNINYVESVDIKKLSKCNVSFFWVYSSSLSCSSYPDEQLRDHNTPLAAGQVQGCPAVTFPAGFVDLVSGAVRQQYDHEAQVFLRRGPQ